MKNNELRARAHWARKAVAIAAFAATSLAIAQGQSAPDLARAEDLVRNGRYAEAYELLAPFEDRHAGDLKFDYLLARAALEAGNPSKASFIYERILAIEPNYVGVRLEMGRAYLALNDFARAKLEFETVLRFDNLPPDLRTQAETYARAAEGLLSGRRTAAIGYAEYGYGYDSNVFSATSINPIFFPPFNVSQSLPPEALKRGDQYHALVLGGEITHGLSRNWALYGGADGRGRWYRDLDTGDFLTGDLRGGVSYTEGRLNTRLGVVGGAYTLDNRRIRDSYGVNGDVRYLVTPSDQISGNLGVVRFRYRPDALESQNFDLYQGAASWLRALGGGRATVVVTALGGYENDTDERIDGNKRFAGGRLSLQGALTDRLGAFSLFGVQRANFDRENPSFGLTRRDTLYDVTAGVTWSFAAGWSLRPQVSYFKNNSNIPLYEYDKTDVSVNVRKDF